MTDKKVAGVLLLRRDGALLMQLRDLKPGLPYAGYWSIPSGHREPGESAEICARREFFEETSYRLGNFKALVEMTDRDDTGAEYLLTLFWACYDGVQPLKCHEGQDLRFIERPQAASHRMPPFVLSVWDHALKEFHGSQHQKN